MATADNLQAVGRAFKHGIAFKNFRSSLRGLTTRPVPTSIKTANHELLRRTIVDWIWRGLEFGSFILGVLTGIVTVLPLCVFLISLGRRMIGKMMESVKKERTPPEDQSERVDRQPFKEYDFNNPEYDRTVSSKRKEATEGETNKSSLRLLYLGSLHRSIPIFTENSKFLEDSIYIVFEGTDGCQRLSTLAKDDGKECFIQKYEKAGISVYDSSETSSLQKQYKIRRLITVSTEALESPDGAVRSVMGGIYSLSPWSQRVTVIFLVNGKVDLPSVGKSNIKNYIAAAIQRSWTFLNHSADLKGAVSYSMNIVVNDLETYDACEPLIDGL